ncbi:MAG: glycosyltransferase family 4 protein [Bryobacteraceae bacterium]|nr:glycosyltransferase family 4 protein [Bryobacteraceae bacterium]
MRVAIDAHTIGLRKSGNESYIRNLLAAMGRLGAEVELLAYVTSRNLQTRFPEARLHEVSRNPVRRLGWDLPRLLRQDCPDVLHVQYTAPLGCPVPLVVSVHDVSFAEHPEYFPGWRRRQLQITVRRTVRRAARLVTGSEFSRQAIAGHYGLNPEWIDVVPIAAAPVFRPMRTELARSRVMQRYQVTAPYVLTVGDLQPRKNQSALVRAFAEAARARPELPHHLVVAGKEGWRGREVKEAARRSGVAERIHFTGHVEDEALVELYNGCDVFVFPSLYEGFGIPVLEAMACGRAVACSGSTALPEVADSAAILFDPRSISQMAQAILDLLLYPELRARMERLGRRRAGQFDWGQTAARMLQIYREAAAGEARGRRLRLPAGVNR